MKIGKIVKHFAMFSNLRVYNIFSPKDYTTIFRDEKNHGQL